MELITQLIISILGVGVAVIELYKFIKQREAKKRDTFKELLPKMEQIYETLNEILHATGAERALVLSTQNGGGIPQVGKPLYSSVLYEVRANTSISPVKNTWQKQLVDRQYTMMLLDVHRHGKLFIDTDLMEEGLLKDVYTSQQIHSAFIFSIGVSKDRFYYLSLSYSKDKQETAELRNAARVAVSKLHKAICR